MAVITTEVTDLGTAICRRQEKYASARTNWDTYWDDIARYILPKKDNVFGQRISGQKLEDFLFDNTSVHSNELLASALHGMLTNPSSIWFGLGTGIERIDQDDEVRKWLQDTVFRMISILNNSNFQTQVHEYYLDIGSFGTGVVKVEEDDKDIIRFQARPVYEHYIAENNLGRVDTVYRCFKFSLKQIKEEWGEEVFDDELRKKFEQDPGHEEEIIHAVEPRSIVEIDAKLPELPKNMSFRSVYVLKKTKKVLEEGGFKENPYVVARWTKTSGEIYGRSPGMKALADIKMLNAMMKVTIQAAQVTVAPPIQVPDDGVLLPIKLNPLATNFFRAGSKDRIEPIITGARPDIGLDIMENVRERVRQAFFIDQLQLNEGPQMTATEVLQRTEEKLRLLGPILGRQHYEFLEPVIARVLRIALDRNQLLPLPAKLEDAILSGTGKLQVKYTSQIAKAQKTSEADNFTRMLQTIMPLMEMKPGMMDNFDEDVLARKMAEVFDVHHTVIKDIKVRDKEREAAAEQEQQQQALEQGEMAANIGQKLQSVPQG